MGLEPFSPLAVVDLIKSIGDPRSISSMYSPKLWILLKSTSFGVRFPVENRRIPSHFPQDSEIENRGFEEGNRGSS